MTIEKPLIPPQEKAIVSDVLAYITEVVRGRLKPISIDTYLKLGDIAVVDTYYMGETGVISIEALESIVSKFINEM